MGYSSYLRARSETISEEGIEGIVDLANVTSQNAKKMEADPELFLSLTYPAQDRWRGDGEKEEIPIIPELN